MAWNSRDTKRLANEGEKSIPLGAPISTSPGAVNRGYKDSWDIDRAYRDGVKKITWVYRCIDAIAGNVARLPVVGRKDNLPSGELDTKADVLDLLNRRSNPGEDSFAFRYRLSAQLLTSTRGAFVEIIRGKGGQPVALHLLPPQFTAPIPDPKTYIAGFEVILPGQPKQILKPSEVLWFKHPHPLDPYLSMTPMEAAGVAIEIENLAKYYNRNFLLNDGRPGGLVVVRGEIDNDDKDELRSRFRGGINRAGAVSVVASEAGVDFVDTSASPRDASYMEMRQITKEEILAAFGVPESVVGNAAGRTYANASEELRVFWLETIPPHLEMLARGMDALDDNLYFEFDTTSVPVLIMAKQERVQYVMSEFQQGLATANEYREASGRKPVDSELADSMLANPNLTPIGNTKKKLDVPQPPGATPAPAPDAGAAVPPPDATTPPGGDNTAAGPGAAPPASDASAPPAEPAPAQQASAPTGAMQFKDAVFGIETKEPDEWDVKAEATTDRWTAILDRSLERLFERQQRVVTEKALGAKARKALAAGTLSAATVFDLDVWNKQMDEDIRPVIAGIVTEAANLAAEQTGEPVDLNDPAVQQYLDDQVARVQKANETTRAEIATAIQTAQAFSGGTEEDRHLLLKAAVVATFLHLLNSRRRTIAEHEAQTAYNAGTYISGEQAYGRTGGDGSNVTFTKTWVSMHDSRVRTAHRGLDGKSVRFDEGFTVGNQVLRFPGDPLAPPELTINCRCRLRWSKS